MRALSLALIMTGLFGSPIMAHVSPRAIAASPAYHSTVSRADDGTLAPVDGGRIPRASPIASTVAPNLPGPALGESASAQDYLRAAQSALAGGRTREAQQALEMAQTRMLDRSVPYGQTNNPSDNPGVARVSQALRALAAGDRAGCLSAIQSALAAPQ